MLKSTNCLLAINNYYYRRGGAEVLFLEHNRLFEMMGWQVVPFATRHPNNLPSAWSEYFPDEIELHADYGIANKLIRVPRVIYSVQTRQRMRWLLDKSVRRLRMFTTSITTFRHRSCRCFASAAFRR